MDHETLCRTISTALLLVGLAALPYLQQARAQSEAGWIVLFDGKSLDNWNQIGDANWKLDDGVVIADKGNGFLISKNSYTGGARSSRCSARRMS